MLGLVLVPGLLSAGIGALIFTGLGSWSGLGTFSLAIPDLPHFGQPDAAEFGWALVIGVLAALLGSGIRWLARYLRSHVERRMLLLTVMAGLAVAGLAIAFAAGTGKGTSEVLFSGQNALRPLVTSGASYTVNALLLLLLVCKAAAYSVSMSSVRGGPVFPALFAGPVGGMLMSHLPGPFLVPGVAMGMGAMSVVLLELPLTSVLLATLILGKDGLAVMPLAIVAVVVAHMVTLHLTRASKPPAEPGEAPPDAGSGSADSGSSRRTGSRPAMPS
jgi:hypothetical protein